MKPLEIKDGETKLREKKIQSTFPCIGTGMCYNGLTMIEMRDVEARWGEINQFVYQWVVFLFVTRVY